MPWLIAIVVTVLAYAVWRYHYSRRTDALRHQIDQDFLELHRRQQDDDANAWKQ